ncbi:MAG: polyphosphate kinase 1 [Hymenobacteraceae bacterium]|nr:polyphosphate kinase 1 [Hymenobacteraceae bacterium]MDX5397929.1 polyphosphate kinase 1 [Hymenobacteraceae bacterium]MDX5443304.1 polyphosphate kinase 1 [Hymenobacteraceae bacterium]MDX5513998.1 polyphosphate kinase 1 [Hymenobacteraceae bacterium]
MDKPKEKIKPTKNELPIIDRELSWLAFNYRVLQEAKDPTVPLLERIKFLAIFSSNLDEYFKVRVATLRRLIKLKKKTRQKLSSDPAAELELILKEVGRQQKEFGKIFRENILEDLKKENINLITEQELKPAQKKFVKEYFEEHLRPLLKPVVLQYSPSHIFLKDQLVYLTIHLSEPKPNAPLEEQFVVMEVPTQKHGGRFVKLPRNGDNRYVMFIDDIIRFNLPKLFPEYNKIETYAIKLSRDAELDISEEVSGNLLAKIKNSLKKRETGYPARLLYDPESPRSLVRAIEKATGISDDELIKGSKYHNFRDFFQFPDFNLPELKYKPQPTLPHPELEHKRDLFAAIREKDYLVHYPYQKFDYLLRLFSQAAKDPTVTAMSATLYRVADKSKVAKALLKAAKNGKNVTVVVELKARFDEESNIFWAQKLEKAGANVIYSVPDHKVHTKLGLITRIEKGKPINYAYLSTGNYNEVTAHIYCDHALFTADPRLTEDVQQVFNFFIDQQFDKKFKHLLVAPFNMRDKFVEMINTEMRNARKGLPASMILKMNALQDRRMIQKLYEASQAGVKIQLVVRGICCLVPGIEGISENITVRSIIDRYLEHARVYIFHNNGKEKLYVASADWMTRNLSRRIEVGFPVYDKSLHQELRHIIDLQLADNVKARDIRNKYIQKPSKQQVRSQYATYGYLAGMLPHNELEALLDEEEE